jgi:hypothetical protein
MKKRDPEIDEDSLEELKEMLENSLEYRRWTEVEDALHILNDLLGYSNDEESEEE